MPRLIHRLTGELLAAWEENSPVDLRGRDLRWANLCTDLWNVDLRGADIRGADLRYSYLWATLTRGALYDRNTLLPVWPMARHLDAHTLRLVKGDDLECLIPLPGKFWREI